MTKKLVLIEGKRSGYSPGQIIDDTITIGELKEIIEGMDDDTRVLLSNDNGYTYGYINESTISQVEYDEKKDEISE